MIEIIALEGRWIFVGETKHDDDEIEIKCGANIRYWGTSRGLGELASGPTKETKLDPIPTCYVPKAKLCGRYEVDQKAWSKVLKELK